MKKIATLLLAAGLLFSAAGMAQAIDFKTVSDTHLDVYKRQAQGTAAAEAGEGGGADAQRLLHRGCPVKTVDDGQADARPFVHQSAGGIADGTAEGAQGVGQQGQVLQIEAALADTFVGLARQAAPEGLSLIHI